MATGEIVRVVIDHGAWSLGLFLTLILTRSRPSRELGRVISIEIRWQYLERKGVPDAELRRLLRDGWNDKPTSNHRPRSKHRA